MEESEFNAIINIVSSSNLVTLENFDRICRTCLGNEKLSPIANTVIANLEVADLLEYSVTIQYNKDDFLPKNICESCVKQLHKVYKFKKQCQEVEAALKLLTTNIYVTEQNVEEEFSCDVVINEDLSSDFTVNNNKQFSCDFPVNESNVTPSLPDDCNKDLSEIRNEDNVDSTFRQIKCNHCDYTAFTKEELQEHRKLAKHPRRILKQCEICNVKVYSLKDHMRSHTKEQPYECEDCFRRFSFKANLRRHRMIHTGERPHVCKICGRGFIQGPTLQAHMKTHHKYGISNTTSLTSEERPFQCEVCGCRFRFFSRFSIHKKIHASTLETADKSEVTNGSRHYNYMCDVCGRVFPAMNGLKYHQRIHGEKSHLCSYCGKGFVLRAALNSHVKVHTGEKPYSCHICNRRFRQYGSLYSHLLIHTGVKPYRCSECEKSFTQLAHLKTHLKTHTGERPYKCSYCNRSFALNGNLTVHIRTHTGETPYVCPVCSKGFYDASSMKRHWRRHKEVEVEDKTTSCHEDVNLGCS